MAGTKTKIKGNNYLGKYISYNQYFSPAECKQIISLLGETAPSLLSQAGEDQVSDTYVRNSTSTYIGKDGESEWLFDRIETMMWDANQYYRFDIKYIAKLQVIKYNEGDFFNWHLDIGEGESSTRKLSLISFLSDPSEYEGGDLRVGISSHLAQFEQHQGSAIVFPSYIPHVVEKVTKGTRYSLVAWIHGPSFR